MIRNPKKWWQLRVAGEIAVGFDDIFRRRIEENKYIQKSTLGKPVCMSVGCSTDSKAQWVTRSLGFDDIDPRFSSVKPEDPYGRVLSVGLHERNRAIKGHWAVRFVFKNISVVKSIRILVITVAPAMPNQ